ncbi:hypothetical protein D9757_010697 [Collybiopsis confluens]|uniref:Uncharacterized protein n=1 Tax=Collybiopsis confluens TaxID=2823264 RepID=A0A8H5H9R5_9AGAR|nr:hypothetical protein D9757_010697 [Collybiopsis confluens]
MGPPPPSSTLTSSKIYSSSSSSSSSCCSSTPPPSQTKARNAAAPSSVVEPRSRVLFAHDNERPRNRLSSMSLFKGPPPTTPSYATPRLMPFKFKDKPLPSLPAPRHRRRTSNIRDYMPPSASRSSWSGMPYSQFERRMRYYTGEGTTPEELSKKDSERLKNLLLLLIGEMNTRRASLGLPMWSVPTRNLELMRHVCIAFFGGDDGNGDGGVFHEGKRIQIPKVKMSDDGKGYVIDYDTMEREWELDEQLMDVPLIDISTKEEREAAEKKREELAYLWKPEEKRKGKGKGKKTKHLETKRERLGREYKRKHSFSTVRKWLGILGVKRRKSARRGNSARPLVGAKKAFRFYRL